MNTKDFDPTLTFSTAASATPAPTTYAANDVCPRCADVNTRTPVTVGRLQWRNGQFEAFLGCDQYPACNFTANARKRGRPFQKGSDPRRKPRTAATPAVSHVPAPIPAHAASAHTAPATASGTLEEMIRAIAAQAAAQSVNEDRVREIVAETNAGVVDGVLSSVRDVLATHVAPPSHFTVQVAQAAPVTIQGAAHVALQRVLMLAALRFNILLVGPAGCGKTHLGEQLATALGLPFATLSCAPGLPESALLGRMVPNLSTGEEHYRDTPFVRAYRDGGVFLIDEVDNSDPSTMLVLNAALANGHMTLPNGERIERHPDFILIASANTYGHGQSREYVGRTQLDAAFLDRFACATVTLDYDEPLERVLCPRADVRDAVQAVRAKVRALKLRRVVSTRGMQRAHDLVTRGGESVRDALLALTEGWTAEDRRACGVQGA